jgi:hypothetical protein
VTVILQPNKFYGVSKTSLTNIQKLYYLINCLKRRAEQIIDSLVLTDGNYNIDLQLEKEHYDNKYVIVKKHIRTLMNLPAIVKESASNSRELIDSMSTHLRVLKSLGQLTDSWDTLPIYTFTAKLIGPPIKRGKE